MDEIKYQKDILNYHIYKVKSIDSTNTFFKENYDKYPSNSILIAKTQTNGRGRYDRVWQSFDKDLCFSILIKDKKLNYEVISPLSIVLALNDYNICTFIKWPNDIYLNDLKLSGILIEDIYLNEFKASIIGIGINQLSKINLGIGLNEIKNIDNMDLLSKILYYFNLLLEKDYKYINELYIKYSYVIGKDVYYNNKLYKVINIDNNNHLVLKNEEEVITVLSDEINIKKAMA